MPYVYNVQSNTTVFDALLMTGSLYPLVGAGAGA